MNTDDFVKQIIHRLENPYSAPAIIARPANPQPEPMEMIDGQPDELLEIVTPDGKVCAYILRSYWDVL